MYKLLTVLLKTTEIIEEKNKLSNREFICIFYNYRLTSNLKIRNKKGGFY
jgi:hypothetical protein